MAFQTVKVTILPANEVKGDFSKERIYPCLLKYSWMFDKEEKGKLIYSDSNIKTPTQLQHLYIISDDEIKLFDWVYNNKENIVEQITSITQLIFVLEENKENQTFKKVIATTNVSLDLPQPSKQFIEKYIEEYNNGNIITDIKVEYKRVFETIAKGMIGHPEDDISWWNEKLKINPNDNTITIKKLKDSWNREEYAADVKRLCNLLYFSSNRDVDFNTKEELDNWIDQNL